MSMHPLVAAGLQFVDIQLPVPVIGLGALFVVFLVFILLRQQRRQR